MTPTPVIRYSPARYRLFLAMAAATGVSLCTYGVALGKATSGVAGLAVLVFLAILLRSVIDRVRVGGVALAREGNMLVGGELKRSMPADGTEFEIVPSGEGGWALVLRDADTRVRLTGDGGGWKIEGERRVTKELLERVLFEMGLTPGPTCAPPGSPS